MSHLRIVRPPALLAADAARAKLAAYLDSISMTAGQRGRLTDLVGDYGARQYEAGYAEGEQAGRPKGAA